MDDILDSIEHQLHAVVAMEDRLSDPVQGFVSAIRINGKPIPPPVMTEKKRLEMRNFKMAAVKRENELANGRRLRLLDKVQTIVDQIEERRSCSQASQVDEDVILHEDKTDLSLNQDDLEGHDEVSSPTAVVNQACSSEVLPCSVGTHIQDDRKPGEGMASGQGSTSSSSDISLLNQTVVAVSDLSKNSSPEVVIGPPSDLSMGKNRKDSVVNVDVPPASHHISPLSKSSEISCIQSNQDLSHEQDSTKSIDSFSQGITAGVRLACSWHKETDPSVPESTSVSQDEHLPSTRSYLMPSLINPSQGEMDDVESFGERDSYLSLLGEYSSLPMPMGSSHFFSDVSEVPMKSGNDSGKTQRRSAEKPGRSECISSPYTDDDCSMFLSTSSTIMTNTVGQSCTLPSSLRTVSAASTLHDVDDPWNTLIETPVPNAEVSEVCPKGNVTRGTPVGQEDSCEITPVQDAAIFDKSEIERFSSPEKRVRRDSYTLEHPSPALLSAQARNEAPQVNQAENLHKSSGEGSPQMNISAEKSDLEKIELEKAEGRPLVQNNEPTEENVLQLQLQHLEQMRQCLEQQQKQQLQQLLFEQQQAQISLQEEMAQLERQFRQKHLHDIDHRDRHIEDVPEVVSGGKKANAKSQMLATSPATDSKSKEPSPSLLVSQPTLSEEAVIAVSPTINSTNSGQLEPFYLGQSLGSNVDAKSSSPSTVRMLSSGENVQTALPFGSPNNKVNFDKISAVAKGYLTRRIFKSQRVQSIIKTIKDSATFADKFISETPIKKGGMSLQDMALAERVLAQVRASQYDLYDIFHTYTAAQRMELIKQSRVLTSSDEKKNSPKEATVPPRPLSAATIKALERKKKARDAEAKIFGDNKAVSKVHSRRRPMSAAEGRILKPLVSQRSPARPSSVNKYRPSRYGDVNSEDLPKAKDTVRSKVISQRAPFNSKEGSKPSRTRSPVTSKTKGVRRSLYPIISNPSKRAIGRTTDRQ